MFNALPLLGVRRHRTWPEWALTYLYVFRVVVVGTCLALLAFAWLTHIEWLFWASACIAIGEFIECSYYIMVLKWGEHLLGTKAG